jgi:hypothetical protein
VNKWKTAILKTFFFSLLGGKAKEQLPGLLRSAKPLLSNGIFSISMTIPVPPWWLRILNGGNAHNYAVAALAFVVGYYWGKGDRNHWRDIARSADGYWRKEHGWHDDHQNGNHGRHTEREHEREHRKHGEWHAR